MKDRALVIPTILFSISIIFFISLNTLELNLGLLKNYQLINTENDQMLIDKKDFESKNKAYFCHKNLCTLSLNKLYNFTSLLKNIYICKNKLLNLREIKNFESEYNCLDSNYIISNGIFIKENLITSKILVNSSKSFNFIISKGLIDIKNLKLNNNFFIVSNSNVKIENLEFLKENLTLEIYNSKSLVKIDSIKGKKYKLTCLDNNLKCSREFKFLDKIESLVLELN